MTYRQENERLFATVGGRIRAVRYAKELTGDDVASKLNVSRPTWVNWENDKSDIPTKRVDAFAKLTKVSAEWLKRGEGEVPELDWSKVPEKQYRPPSNVAPLPMGTVVSEIKPRLTAHAKGLDTAPQASWTLPREVLTLGFNCDPDSGFIKRSPLDGPPLPDGTPINRGDYVLIDATRNVVNEPGLYYVADPNGREARRVIVALEGDALVAKVHRTGEAVDLDRLEVLGRAMAVFHAI